MKIQREDKKHRYAWRKYDEVFTVTSQPVHRFILEQLHLLGLAMLAFFVLLKF